MNVQHLQLWRLLVEPGCDLRLRDCVGPRLSCLQALTVTDGAPVRTSDRPMQLQPGRHPDVIRGESCGDHHTAPVKTGMAIRRRKSLLFLHPACDISQVVILVPSPIRNQSCFFLIFRACRLLVVWADFLTRGNTRKRGGVVKKGLGRPSPMVCD